MRFSHTQSTTVKTDKRKIMSKKNKRDKRKQ